VASVNLKNDLLQEEIKGLDNCWQAHVQELREKLDNQEKDHKEAFEKKHKQYQDHLEKMMKYLATCEIIKEYGAQLANKRLEEEKKEKETKMGD
jgi:hypothetical protein